MKTREWLMTEKTLLDRDVDSFEDLSPQEKENLNIVMTELRGWATQNVDLVLSVMAEDGVYYDITGEPAVGHDGIREFGIGWVDAVPDFVPYIEAFVVQDRRLPERRIVAQEQVFVDHRVLRLFSGGDLDGALLPLCVSLDILVSET